MNHLESSARSARDYSVGRIVQIFRVAAACAALTLCAHAEQLTFTLDPAKSVIDFTLGATAHTVHGTFRFKSGSLRFDSEGGAASGTFIADANSGNSGNDSRDNRMKRSILETGKYPEVILAIDRIEGPIKASGESTVKTHGMLTLHGQSHEVEPLMLIATDANGTRATCEISIPYVSWGLKNPSTFILRVSDKVILHVTAIGKITSQ